MAFRISKALSNTYSEISQKNPLRWEILFRDGDSFKPVTGKLKCRDFFNDMVARLMDGKLFQIYRFDNSVAVNKDGVWFRLTGIEKKAVFIKNLEVLNNYLAEALGFGMMVVNRKDDQLMLFIPRYFWTKTYYISALTGLIRIANYGVEFESYEKMLSSPLIQQDGAINGNGLKLMKKIGFKMPEQYNAYWWYHDKNYNSVKSPDMSDSTIHNNGVNGWGFSLASSI